MKKLLSIAAVLMAFSALAQNVNDYRYIIIPSKFSIFKEANKYNLNNLTKSVFEKQGFQVYYENDIHPQELAENRCKALFADLKENNSLFMTKIMLELKDCKNQVVYLSPEGQSREKEFAKAYVQAFREVGKAIGKLQSAPKMSVTEPGKTDSPVAETKVIPKASPVSEADNGGILFAQPTAQGFQLIDNTPKIVFRLFKTSVPDYYLAEKSTQNGLVYRKDTQWYFDSYRNGQLFSEKLEIKF